MFAYGLRVVERLPSKSSHSENSFSSSAALGGGIAHFGNDRALLFKPVKRRVHLVKPHRPARLLNDLMRDLHAIRIIAQCGNDQEYDLFKLSEISLFHG